MPVPPSEEGLEEDSPAHVDPMFPLKYYTTRFRSSDRTRLYIFVPAPPISIACKKRVSTKEMSFIWQHNFDRVTLEIWCRVASAHAKLNFSMALSHSMFDPVHPQSEKVL